MDDEDTWVDSSVIGDDGSWWESNVCVEEDEARFCWVCKAWDTWV